MTIYNSIQFVFLLLLSAATLYILFFAVAGLFYKQKVFSATEKCRRMAVLIPGYKEDEVIVEVAKSALQQKYPMAAFDIIVIADSFKKATLEKLKTLPVRLVEVSFEKSTKSKALNKAMDKLKGVYDIAVVLDADNMMAPDFLHKINAAFENGYIAVQGHRKAKNLNNSWAILDAISEEINNHIFRKGHRAVGLSSAIIGSGMAFDYNFFKAMMVTVDAIGGFDKEIELKMLKRAVQIEYIDDAYVYDEKIQQAEVFSNQRRRWLSAQVHYFRLGIADAIKDLLQKGNVDYFDKAIQFIQPPRVLLLGSVLLCSGVFIVLNYFLGNSFNHSINWLVLSVACCVTLLISIPTSFYNRKTLIAMAGLPKGMLMMLLSLLKIKGANKTFIHTKHSSTTLHTNS